MSKRTYKRPTFEAAIMQSARKIAALQREARELRRKLKANSAAMRVEKRHMRALVNTHTDGEQAPPLRQFGERQGGSEK